MCKVIQISGIAIVCAVLLVLFVPPAVLKNAGLYVVEWLVHQSADVKETTPRELAENMQHDSARFLVFDVREREEYNESHIKGAIHLLPSTSVNDFMRLYGRTVQDKKIVMYCSVGKRSSDAALRMEGSATEAGAASVKNLRGGIFRWYNDGFPVCNNQGFTREIHTYSKLWSFFVAQ
jgi:rhodanese-related sulfurtransferase